MELTQLKYFYVVSKYQHITKSAKLLNVSQSTLSIAIANLEKELGVKLFHKQGRNIELTPAGALFAAKIRPALIQIQDAQTQIMSLNESSVQEITLSIEVLDFTTQIERAYLTMHPKVHFHHSFDTTTVARSKLLANECDICISYTPFDDPEIHSELLMESPLELMVHKNHPLAGRKSVSLQELAGEPMTCLPKGYGFHTMVCEIFRHEGIEPIIAYEACEFSMLSFSVETNAYISFVDKLMRDEALYTTNAIHRDLRIIPVEEDICREQIFLCYPKARRIGQAGLQFIDYLRKCIPVIQELGHYPSYSELEVFGA